MLRWPTPYLCHLTNRARHLAFGPDAANRIAAAELGQTRAAQKAYDENQKGDFESLQKVDLETNPLEVALWADLEPYVNRPIVSVHVRGGGEAKEVETFSLAAHMWLSEKLRFQVPNLKHIWLSTAMQVRKGWGRGWGDGGGGWGMGGGWWGKLFGFVVPSVFS